MEINKQAIVLRSLFSLPDDPAAVAWQPFRDGIDIYPIYRGASGCSAALLRYPAGSSIPLHEHTGYEHILILSGEQADQQQQVERGDLLISPPGTRHAVNSTKGCIVLAIWERPVQFV